MDVRMTWTVLYTDDNLKMAYKTVDAPHGASEAWAFIKENYSLSAIAIISGMHDIYHANDDDE